MAWGGELAAAALVLGSLGVIDGPPATTGQTAYASSTTVSYVTPPASNLVTVSGLDVTIAPVRTSEIKLADVAAGFGLVPSDRAESLDLGRAAFQIADERNDPRPLDVRDPYSDIVSRIEGGRRDRPVALSDLGATGLGLGPRDRFGVDYTLPGVDIRRGDFDIALTPRADFTVGDLGSTARAGALVRLGRNFTQAREARDGIAWYAFAGADAQALTWAPDERRSFTSELRVEDKAIVGDIQAGVGMQIWGGDLAVGYINRETTYELATENYSQREEFFAVTFSVRR